MRRKFLSTLSIGLILLSACTSKQEQYITYDWYPVMYNAQPDAPFSDKCYKYVNTSGQEMVVEGLKEASFFTADGLSRIKFKSEKGYGYLNTKGELAIPTRYYEATLFSEGLAWAKRLEGNMNDPVEVINTKGETVFTLSVRKVRRFKEGLCAVSDGDKWGYVNKKGEVVISNQYYDARDFCNGLAAIRTENGWGFIDQKGNIVIEPQYREVRDFDSNGQVVVLKRRESSIYDADYLLIDKRNNVIIAPGRYQRIDSDGTIYRCSNPQQKELIWCNKSGKELFEKPVSCDWEGINCAQFNDSEKAWTGTCFVNRKGKIDEEMTSVGKQYYEIQPFINGFAMVKGKRGYGVINDKGEEVIEAKYYQFGFGSEGYKKDETLFY